MPPEIQRRYLKATISPPPPPPHIYAVERPERGIHASPRGRRGGCEGSERGGIARLKRRKRRAPAGHCRRIILGWRPGDFHRSIVNCKCSKESPVFTRNKPSANVQPRAAFSNFCPSTCGREIPAASPVFNDTFPGARSLQVSMIKSRAAGRKVPCGAETSTVIWLSLCV